jgi:hypothetical protein
MWPLPRGLILGLIAAVVVAAAILWIAHELEQRGYEKRVAEQAAADGRAENDRKRDDARQQGLSDYDACRDYLGGRRLSVEPCEQLRGFRAE